MRLLYLVQVRTRFGGYTFKCLHILNEELTSSLDCSGVGTIFPARAESRVDQAVSPGRVKTCRLGVYTGYLSASNEATAVNSQDPFPTCRVLAGGKLTPESRCLEEFSSKLFGFI